MRVGDGQPSRATVESSYQDDANAPQTHSSSSHTWLMQAGAGGAGHGGSARGGHAPQSFVALELVLLEKFMATAESSATGWQPSHAFDTVIVKHSWSELQGREYFSSICAREAWYCILPASQLTMGGWSEMQEGQHAPACISGCVSTGQDGHSCLHSGLHVAQHAPSGTTSSLPLEQTMSGQSTPSQTFDAPPAPSG